MERRTKLKRNKLGEKGQESLQSNNHRHKSIQKTTHKINTQGTYTKQMKKQTITEKNTA